MGTSCLLCALLWAAIFPLVAGQAPAFLITAPRLLHLGVQEDVWVQMEWLPGSSAPKNDITVVMYLRNQINMLACSKQYTVTLNQGNSHIAKQPVELTNQMASTCKLDESKGKRYVQLVVSSVVLGSQPRVVSLPVSYKRGYIFIQTDKSIYTPKEAVNIRLFPLDHMMRPTNDQIIYTVSNAEGVQVKKMQRVSESKLALPDKLQIPDISSPGVWKISAYYSTAPESNFTAEFEVRKYVLPNFEVKVIPELPYILITNTEFSVRAEARYVYGEVVEGVASFRLGIIDQEGQKTMLQGLEKQLKLVNGDADVQIGIDDILKKIKQPKEILVGSTLYIAVSVMEKASGTIEEKEVTSVKFVTSPYKLDLSKTKKYFTPGTPAQIVAEVTLSDGSPANRVMVSILKSNIKENAFTTDDRGFAVFQINTDSNEQSLDITVKAGEAGLQQVETIKLLPYSSTAKSFLHMEIPNKLLNPGETISVILKVLTPNPTSVKRVYYMVLNKGQIVDLKFIDRTDYMVLPLYITPRMVPSFRIIAYYHLSSEIVANSAWVDVTDVCEGKLHIKTDVKDSILPGMSFKMTLATDTKTSVSLSAVDTAVYLLNSKNRLTPNKVFKAMNDYDLGCSPGGGKDYKSVFVDAGLAFVSSAGYSHFSDSGCDVSQRKKRSIDFPALTKQKVNTFSSAQLKGCCNNGMTLLPPRMERDCDKRASRIESSDCRNAFSDCCKYAEDLRKQMKKRRQNVIARTQAMGEEDDFMDESDVQSRSSFPESWLWRTVVVDKNLIETVHVPDSITTWEIQGIGMSEGKGFCVTDPVKVKVFKRFHIHLRVPYSIKRFEQLELRPVLYNYIGEDLKVKVLMENVDGICTPVTRDGDSIEQIVMVPSYSAVSVPFAVVPIGKVNPVVTVKALGPFGIADAVKKTLRIEREGVSVVEERTYLVNPEDDKRTEIEFDDELPSNMIPDGDFRASIRVTLDSPMNTINNSLSAEGVNQLIRVPFGCAEQTMISTAPGVYAMRYLDHTEKWTTLPPDRKDQGLENMNNGYARILQYRKPDGSYGAWLNRQSSTWLTAFVVKVMSLCRKYIEVDVEEIRKSAIYLTSKQTITAGSFQETMPVIHQDMMGGVSGKSVEVSLTAYVLVALYHSQGSLPEDDVKVKTSISLAIDYLRTSLNSISDPYSLALTTYALTLTSGDTILKDKAYNKLMSTAQSEPSENELYFGPKATALAVETTSYALLTALRRKDMTSAKKIYTWLSEQQNYGGGFKSTQDTVMALEALSEYWIATYTNERNELTVDIKSLERSHKQRFTLRSQESVQEELRSMGTKFMVSVSGKGTGQLTVLKMYNIMQVENSTCSQLELEVNVFGDDGHTEPDYYDYDYGDEEEEMSDEPRENIEWHDLRRRARREVSQPKTKEVNVIYQVCLWRNPKARASGMAIVDITMLSGFEPNTQDLDKLKEGAERYISHYEITAGRLLMYFDKVSSSKECVTFEATQTVRISPLQPASAILYDFYEPDNQCRVFYSAPSKSSFISTLCSDDVCQCAEGPCPTIRRTQELPEADRQRFACYFPRVVYGYRVKVLEVEQKEAFMSYKGQIVEVLQRSSDERITAGEIRYFYQQASCKMRLGQKEYLIMGQDGQTKDENGRMRYFLEDNSWIEELASPQTCKATRYRNMCFNVSEFMRTYRENGCMV